MLNFDLPFVFCCETPAADCGDIYRAVSRPMMPFQRTSQIIGTGTIPGGHAFVTADSGDIFAQGMNDKPLDFVRGPRGNSRSTSRDRDEDGARANDKRFKGRDRRDERPHEADASMPGTQEGVPIDGGSIGAANVWMGMGYPMVGVNMVLDPNVVPINNFGIIPPILGPTDPNMIAPNQGMILNPVKEIIHCKSCTLFPPNPNAPPPPTRERPPGCRTVFVGGLPEKMTEEIITEIFERCGEISTLRLSKKNFCHVRFLYEASVDAAIFLSGYRVRIGSNADTANTGRLHVDYAQARDDQYEFECRQRQLQREQRHRERMEEERLRPPSPRPIIHYTEHEAATIAEKIKQDDTFTKAVQVVITWLERGDCSKKNANTFYSMIQSTNSHVRRLLNEKTQYEDELKKAREIMKTRMQGILLQFSQIERLFMAACHKKVWDHFTKAQRKNIESWKKQSLEVKNVQLEEQEKERERDDDEMEVSDDDEPSKKKRVEMSNEERNLKEENECLKMQIEAYKNEVEVLKIDHKSDLEEKDKQFKMLQQTLHGMQQQLIDARKRQTEEEGKVRELQSKLNKTSSRNDKDNIINLDEDEVEHTDSMSTTESLTDKTDTIISRNDAKLIGVISAFLNVHPFGAGLDYIWSYVSKIEADLRPADIEALMNRFPTVFKQELVGIGANIERKWIFNAFSNARCGGNNSHTV